MRFPVRIIFMLALLAIATSAGCAELKTVRIDAPTPCHRLERVEGDRVYLVSSPGICTQVITKMPVELEESVAKVEIYVDGRLWLEQPVAGGAEAVPAERK